jgi:transposase-like protein
MEDNPATGRVQRPETEVRPGTGRRQFTRAYKQRILALYDACDDQGGKSALLRREGLYSGYITNWRRQMAKTGSKNTRGRPRLTPAEREARELRAENERLKKRLERAELALDVQKKLLALLESYSPETNSASSNTEPSSSS